MTLSPHVIHERAGGIFPRHGDGALRRQVLDGVGPDGTDQVEHGFPVPQVHFLEPNPGWSPRAVLGGVSVGAGYLGAVLDILLNEKATGKAGSSRDQDPGGDGAALPPYVPDCQELRYCSCSGVSTSISMPIEASFNRAM